MYVMLTSATVCESRILEVSLIRDMQQGHPAHLRKSHGTPAEWIVPVNPWNPPQ